MESIVSLLPFAQAETYSMITAAPTTAAPMALPRVGGEEGALDEIDDAEQVKQATPTQSIFT